MGAILNGLAYDGIFKPFGSTYLVFSDYLKPAIRVGALAQLPVGYLFSHDSIALGEDGPTHQPVEQLASYQLMPNLLVMRPADYDETVGSFHLAARYREGPSLFILSRQALPPLPLNAEQKRRGTLRGAYLVRREQENLEYIILASGSEVQLALEVANLLGTHTRVISVPSRGTFLRQDQAYRSLLLPFHCRRRVAIELGSPQLWYQFVGLHGLVIGMERFGESGSAKQLLEKFHFTPQDCYQKILRHAWEVPGDVSQGVG
jgi:transketolase